ncbi:MAG: NAD(P)-dependent oxidoreductase [Candidatus Organicella extenuata]|jgi:nucleoside-diphosphate-sugar epimerase|uniref:NAD(P)-dependent oxidoreductase n=1 Tax=Candidatus Organicella extenuata TaxID=2841811 RepID=A0AA51GFM9_9BACT|nr:MAG: NAD(P)-dependent oxidoreductase [Candidatus Organicella extenuata]
MNSLNYNNILITGGSGYIGSVLVPALLYLNYNVTVIDNFYYKQTSLLPNCYSKNFTIINGDCRDEKLLTEHLNKCGVVIPLAAIVGAPLCSKDPFNAKSINEDAIIKLCSLLKEGHRVIYPTTNSGYGIGQKGKFCDENTPLNPISLYGKTKVAAEKAVLGRKNSISYRLATVFGTSSRMRLDLLVNDFVYRAVNDKCVTIFEGHFKRNYIHIRDVVRAFLFAISNFSRMKGNAYNVGLNKANLSKLELCAIIKKSLPEFIFREDSTGFDLDKRDYIVSNDKLMSLGFNPLDSLESGIEELKKAYVFIKNNHYSNV